MSHFGRQIPNLIVITITFGVIYMITQQALRSAANFPQIKMVEDAVVTLSADQSLSTNTLGSNVDILLSPSEFMNVYNSEGKAIYGSGYLDGKLVTLSPDILQSAKDSEVRFSWQPKDDARFAVVLAPFHSSTGSGYVMAGRGMKEVMSQGQVIMIEVVIGWFLSILAVLSYPHLVRKWQTRRILKRN